MFDAFLSQMLIVFLLFIVCVRFFFARNLTIDSCSVLAPIAFFLSLANIFLWNLTVPNIFLAALSFIVFATNFRAILRLFSRVFVDRYSALFSVFSILELILIVFSAVFLILNRPVKIEPKNFNSKKTVYRLSGSISHGFEQLLPGDFFYSSTGILKIYEPLTISSEKTELKKIFSENTETTTHELPVPTQELTQKKQKPIIVFCGSETAETQDYEPYLLFLSKKGFTVLAADFYSHDCLYLPGILNSRIFRKFMFLNDKNNFQKSETMAAKLNHTNSYKALAKLTQKLYGKDFPLFFVFDSLDFNSICQITENAGVQTAGFFSLNTIQEYKTSKFGFIEQTNIPLAKKYGLSRDSSLFIPRYLANKTAEQIESEQNAISTAN